VLKPGGDAGLPSPILAEYSHQPDARRVDILFSGPADVVQMAHMIAFGRMIAVLPRSLVEPAPAGLVCVPVTDAPPSRLVLAWNQYDRRPLVASFVAAALASSRASEASTLRAEQRV
jgi:DNA-binding transcriptional LysR family regulator